MAQLTDTYITRKYFNRLLKSFLCISIIPLAACVIAILYANYVVSMETYTRKGKTISDGFIEKLKEAVFEYENIASSIADNPDIIEMLKENQVDRYEQLTAPLIQSLLTGRESRIQIRILDYDNKGFWQYQDGFPSLYHTDIFAEWGPLHQLNVQEQQSLLICNPYTDQNDRIISASYGRKIIDGTGTLIGYVFIDIYRETLVGLLSAAEETDAGVIFCDRFNLIILDTAKENQEGRRLEPGSGTEHASFLRTIFNAKRNTHTHTQVFNNEYGFSLHTYLNISDFYTNMDLLIKVSFFLFCITVFFCQAAASFLAKRLYEPVVEETRRQKDAEIKALQAQISPHFLYNMLNEIKALAKLNRVDEIADFVVHLGRLLRRSITYKEAFVEVRDEIEFIKDYLALQQIRYERSFAIEMDLDEGVMNCRMPKLILQPIVENSIIHGFTDHKKQHLIRITGKSIDQKYLCFEIYDDGVGVDEDYIQYINNVEAGSGIYGGLGVENVQRRLLLRYGMEYGLHIQSTISKYTKVTIILPFEKAQ